ncbi:MAG: OmpA family protein [Saprospiraceae bacterium]
MAGSLNGCPDSDGDGVADPEDSCPNIPGVASNYGCPDVTSTMNQSDLLLLESAKYGVEFTDGSSTLTTASKEILDQIAAILTNYSTYNLSIAGHTDSVGSSGENQKLSERRAKACYDYLISRGVNPSRLSHTGYGESEPLESNKYKAGRAKNRRIEFNVYKR